MSDSPVKSMRGKYDGRRFNGANLRKQDDARIPKTAKKLSRYQHIALRKEYDAICSFSRLYELALNANNLSLVYQMRVDNDNRIHGKPFTATNPDEIKQPNVLVDARIQTAIDKYVVTPQQHTPMLQDVVTLTQAAETGGSGEEK